jgi:hypothetical protein
MAKAWHSSTGGGKRAAGPDRQSSANLDCRAGPAIATKPQEVPPGGAGQGARRGRGGAAPGMAGK